jgi:hypothetical protein
MDLVLVRPVHRYLNAVLMRLAGFYEPIRQTLNEFIGLPAMDQLMPTSVVAGAASGAVGGELHQSFLS